MRASWIPTLMNSSLSYHVLSLCCLGLKYVVFLPEIELLTVDAGILAHWSWGKTESYYLSTDDLILCGWRREVISRMMRPRSSVELWTSLRRSALVHPLTLFIPIVKVVQSNTTLFVILHLYSSQWSEILNKEPNINEFYLLYSTSFYSKSPWWHRGPFANCNAHIFPNMWWNLLLNLLLWLPPIFTIPIILELKLYELYVGINQQGCTNNHQL